MTEENISVNFQYGTDSLNHFFKQGKLNQVEYETIHEAIKNMYKVVNDSLKNYNRLHNVSSVLKKEVTAAKYEVEAATVRQSEASNFTQNLSASLKTAEATYESRKAAYDNLYSRSQDLEKEILNAKMKIKEEMRTAEEIMQPKRDRIQADIDETKAMNEKTANQIENLQRTLQDTMTKINNLRKQNEKYDLQEKKYIELKLKIIDSPEHYFKSAQNLHIEIMGMEAELKETEEEIERKEKICKTNDQKRLNQVKQREEIEKTRLEEVSVCQSIETEIQKLINLNHGLDSDKADENVRIMSLEQQYDQTNRLLKAQVQKISKEQKNIEKLKKQYKKQDVQKKQHEDQILQYEMMINKLKKEKENINDEKKEQEVRDKELENQLLIIANKIEMVKEKIGISEADKKQIQKEINDKEKELDTLKENVASIQKEVKDLTAVRESMARKASSAMSEVRETREELKVKELLRRDLTKKQQETENKLQHFKTLYEEVKSARNKYVNLIQNSSQDLAEFKERIKILQNERQILKNESAEKSRAIQEYNRQFQLEKHKRDQMKAKLNKFEFQNKEKQQMVDQNIKEIQKLNTIMQSLQKDMEKLRKNYNQVCENRNYTGIQLIDRNDQLCILYEKSNMQEIILRKTEMAVKSLQDDMRMVDIEIAETERKIKVARDKILIVPQLAEKVLQLQEQIKIEAQKQRQLSNELENPANGDRWRDLGGEDPDEATLDAKISVLQERLNTKKNQLLEKQLVLDQISNLTEKLKKQADDGRQSTLHVSEKINEFQSRLKDLTRKMKATISELSICQAKAIKYQQERESLEQLLEQAKKRMEEGLPPTPETEIEYLKMMRDKKRYLEEREIRERNEMIERSYPPFATKTTAEHRVNAYIPDEIGLPKPYGRLAPFKPSEKGSNMRHFRKPINKEIEI